MSVNKKDYGVEENKKALPEGKAWSEKCWKTTLLRTVIVDETAGSKNFFSSFVMPPSVAV